MVSNFRSKEPKLCKNLFHWESRLPLISVHFAVFDREKTILSPFIVFDCKETKLDTEAYKIGINN